MRLSIDWVDSTQENHQPNWERLGTIADQIQVAGVPQELLTLIHRFDGLSVVMLAKRFYAPNGLTLAYVERGLQQGLITKDEMGGLHVSNPKTYLKYRADTQESKDFIDFASQQLKRQYYQDLDLRFDHHFGELVNKKRDLFKERKTLIIGDGEGVSIGFKAAGLQQVTVFDIDSSLLEYYQEREIVTIQGDVRFFRNFCLGEFDFITSYQIEYFQDDCILDMVWANLVPYGVYYTYFVPNENERSGWRDFVDRIESRLIITDIVENTGTYLIRALKYPELAQMGANRVHG